MTTENEAQTDSGEENPQASEKLASEEPQSSTSSETPEGPQGQGQEKQGDDFDRDRAMATIRKLRTFEKEAARLKRELEALQSQETDTEDLQDQLTATAAERAMLEMKAAAVVAAGEVGFLHPGDAWALIDPAKLTLKEDGTVDGLQDEIGRLVKEQRLPMRGSAPVVNPGQKAADKEAEYRQDYFGSVSSPPDSFFDGGIVYGLPPIPGGEEQNEK